ncbi:hypothetical protein [Bradyrhizobium sp. sBnM-33]|uniref:hypothetical protein n=1 Tax=Bradyrhizobium sp. sBnM-33 TaxID=2831780 RepID=UPI001BD16622|nr:hypothetical protein [Bradyrhizobium sp. sBnM-33]
MDRTGLQLQRGETGGEVLGVDRNALGIAQSFDVPETIDVQRPANLYELRLNQFIKQRHAAVIRAVGGDRRNNEKGR